MIEWSDIEKKITFLSKRFELDDEECDDLRQLAALAREVGFREGAVEAVKELQTVVREMEDKYAK